MFSIEKISGKGLGIVASRDIKRGEVIAQEAALLMTPISHTYNLTISNYEEESKLQVVPCERCLRSCKVTNIDEPFFSALPQALNCPCCLSAVYCSNMCLRTSQMIGSHICPALNSSMTALVSHHLYINSSRFRLFCQAVSQATAGNKLLISRLHNIVAPAMRTANGLAAAEICDEFESQASVPVNLLRNALGLQCDDTSMIKEDINNFATPQGFTLFWRICAANAQGVSQSSAFSDIMSQLITKADSANNVDLNLTPQEKSMPFSFSTPSLEKAVSLCSSSVMHDCEGTALFTTLSRFNHSCCPNIFLQSMPSKDNQGIGVVVCAKADKDLRKGEELCISYTNQHEELEERYGFRCSCSDS